MFLLLPTKTATVEFIHCQRPSVIGNCLWEVGDGGLLNSLVQLFNYIVVQLHAVAMDMD
jgi:hypothetical protein